MKQKMYPIIVTTMKALRLTVKDEYGVVLIDKRLLCRQKQKIQELMKNHGYVVSEKEGKTGLFLVKNTGPFAFDPQIHEIFDPYNSL